VGSDVYQFVYDPTASIPAVVQEFGPDERNIVYVREPDGSLVARVHPSESSADYYYFDALGSTVLMTQGLSTVTDRYDYRAWGEPRAILGNTTDNPYLYVGELGYYAHWQDPNLADALQLGVRFYEPGVGRFGQMDEIEKEQESPYVYASARPVRILDPDGRQTYPTLSLGKGCSGFGDASWQIRKAQKYVNYVVTTLGLGRCPSTIRVDCYEKMFCGIWPFRSLNRECGIGYPGLHMTINWAGQCPSAYCTILHELIHVCTVPGHASHGTLSIPGCGSESSFGPVTGDVPSMED